MWHLERSAKNFYALLKLCSEASLYQYDRIIYMDADSFPIGSLDNLPLSSWLHSPYSLFSHSMEVWRPRVCWLMGM